MFFKRKLKKPPKIYLPTPRLEPKKAKTSKPILYFLFLVLISFALYYLFFQTPYFLIKNIKVMGTENESLKELCQKVKDQNLFSFNKKELEREILKNPEIKKVIIRRWPPSTLKIKITEKPASICWQTQGKKYLLDSQGLVLGEVKETSLPIVLDSQNLEVKKGEQIATPEFVNFVKNLVFKFTSFTNLPLFEISIPKESIYELVVQTEGFKVIFDTQRDLDEQLDNLTRVYQMKKEEIKEYLDLRIEGRVYYK